MGRLIAVAGVVLAVLGLAPAAGAESSPPGPRLAALSLRHTDVSFTDDKETPPIASLQTFDPSGGQRQTLLEKFFGLEAKGVLPLPYDGVRWTADGRSLVFTGGRGKGKGIHIIGADGQGLRPVPGTKNGGTPVVSPDGRTIAFSRNRLRFGARSASRILPGPPRIYTSTTTWLTDLSTGKTRRLTPWRNGLANTPSSFSPDGTVLAVTRSDDGREGPTVMLTRLDGGGWTVLAEKGAEAAFSPDGSRLAYVSYADGDLVEGDEESYPAAELHTIGADGSGERRLTRSDDVLESAPSWDPSGQRIAYVGARADTHFAPGLGNLFPYGNSVMQINADGSCRRRVQQLRKTAFYGAAWQPGPGREAGPIAC